MRPPPLPERRVWSPRRREWSEKSMRIYAKLFPQQEYTATGKLSEGPVSRSYAGPAGFFDNRLDPSQVRTMRDQFLFGFVNANPAKLVRNAPNPSQSSISGVRLPVPEMARTSGGYIETGPYFFAREPRSSDGYLVCSTLHLGTANAQSREGLHNPTRCLV